MAISDFYQNKWVVFPCINKPVFWGKNKTGTIPREPYRIFSSKAKADNFAKYHNKSNGMATKAIKKRKTIKEKGAEVVIKYTADVSQLTKALKSATDLAKALKKELAGIGKFIKVAAK